MKIVYVTTSLPHGASEAFLIPEINELVKQGHELVVVPFFPRGPIVHRDVLPLLPLTVVRKLISPGVLAVAACEAARHPKRTMAAAATILRSRSFSIGIKNALTLPKGLWLARLARRRGADHIHVHWGGCSSTVAMIASTVSGIPWSMTVHSWELIENNLLREKTASAVFTRTVSQFGQARLSRITGLAAPVRVIHLGIELPAAPRLATRTGVRDFRLIVVANLVEIKGIEFLIEAWKLLESRGIVLRIDIFGDGPLRRKLKTLAVHAGAESYISLHGFISHDLLMSEISEGHWDAIVLPSIFADDGQEEGIPICLVEAMAHGLAAIGTQTGGIPELLAGGAGLLVPPRDPRALADAIQLLHSSPQTCFSLQVNGRKKIEHEFAVSRVVRNLIEQIEVCVPA